MKKSLLAIAAFALLSISLSAQVKTPKPSPTAEIEQEIGLTEIEVEYSRPGVKDRVIFGDLVPYGKMWRTGANAATQIKFDDDVEIEGNPVREGKYALFTIPGEDKWTIILNSNRDINVWNYDEEGEVMRFDVTPTTIKEKVETFTINFNNLRDESCSLEMMWENTKVSFNITTNTDDAVMASIDKTMSGPEARDLYLSARYYFENKKDMAKALEWINKASELDPGKYWVEKWRAEILAANNKYKEAIQVATVSKELAEKAGNNEYVEINKENIVKWSKK